ncbi:uncharacterized protein Z518_10645 [Rhinocladiella mackenziei CBS 650.93]|uniref:Uncharacterized protein n=1 Tax=Rhinocladiella mackenziei CBS 650.93 TaxID=1442369 RepID=A0A0D2IUZ8_9EURO|nr:uncharacterized protein Z518_10645 [Rhinocladiella mackenziei CBS 650.93]KIX00505.1 hypothetical protein Z518_10645 [Rhinocladiella mackenziei CBS 650.93]
MLALTSPISSLHSTYPSSGLAPGVQFALDLTDNNAGMTEQEDFLFSRPPDTANLMPLAESPSPFSVQSRFTPWSLSTYDPFAGEPGGRISPDRTERLRQRLPPEIHGATRAPTTTAVGEPFRPLSFGSQSSALNSDPGTFPPHNLPPRSNPDDQTMALRRQSQDSYGLQTGSPTSQGYTEYDLETQNRRGSEMGRTTRYHTRRRPFNQDEFDGPSQLLPLPLPQQEHARSQALPSLPVHLDMKEQDEITLRVNDILSRCAFHFVAKYQFPIPLERDKPRVRTPADREWTEWAYLLKRLATKRRIPARVLYDNQIKQFVTTLENSIAVRQNSRDQQTRTPKDDRYMLQLVSAGTQVAKILMDSLSMEQLDALYRQTESVILERRARLRGLGFQ